MAVPDEFIIGIQRLHDDVAEAHKRLKGQYRLKTNRVTSQELRSLVEGLAEKWMVEFAGSPYLSNAVEAEYLSNLSVHFQRLLTLPEGVSKRSSYDLEVQPILKNFNARVTVPLKQLRGKEQLLGGTQLVAQQALTRESETPVFKPTVFVGQSFLMPDKLVGTCVRDVLTEIGITVVTGERPKAERISDKVRRLIEAQHIFVGVFTRRDRLARKQEWTTSPWVIDEKAYAFGLGKKLILLKEEGVSSIGGIQGDYEFIEFSRSRLDLLAINLLKLFDLATKGFQK